LPTNFTIFHWPERERRVFTETFVAKAKRDVQHRNSYCIFISNLRSLRTLDTVWESLKVVQTVNYHIQQAPTSLLEMASIRDRAIIKNIVAGVRRLSRQDPEVAIAISGREDNAGKRARTIARQRGRQACKSRRRPGLAHDNTLVEEQQAVRDQWALEEDFELPIRTMESSNDTRHNESLICNW
jgi:hypothetical protein